MRLDDALKAALDLEQKGYDYYREIASRAENPLTQGVFLSLAEQELDHGKRIRELHGSIEPRVTGNTIPADALEKAVMDVWNRFSAQDREAWEMDNAAAYELAMELERQSYAMYDTLALESKEPAEVEFFEALLREESQHLTALENVFSYLTRTGDWFEVEESRVWNWMNT